jgi:hypothetical protein
MVSLARLNFSGSRNKKVAALTRDVAQQNPEPKVGIQTTIIERGEFEASCAEGAIRLSDN